MHFRACDLDGAFAIELAPIRDERGHFMRTFCEASLRRQGLETSFPQHSVSRTLKRGTIRGLHFQRDPHAEVKIVRCLRGAIHDVIVDLRPASPTYRRWQSFELTEDNNLALYVPKGFAHGFQALGDHVEVSYLISASYAPDFASGVRWNDPALAIGWPLPVTVLSAKDHAWPSLE